MEILLYFCVFNFVKAAELTMGQWVMGQMDQQIWVGHVGHGSVPVTRLPIFHCTHPVSHMIFWFIETRKPATAIKTVILTVC